MTGAIPTVVGLEILALALDGQEEEARRRLEQLKTSASAETLAVGALPWAYFALGETDAAFEWLERAAEKPAGLFLNMLRNIPYLSEYPGVQPFASISDDPRYWQLIERLQYPALSPEHPGYADEQDRLESSR